MSLTESGSPWAGAVEAVCATLPALRGDERDAVRRLAAEGPPAEEVGLSPYGGPAFDARLPEARRDGGVDLPMPAVREGAATGGPDCGSYTSDRESSAPNSSTACFCSPGSTWL